MKGPEAPRFPTACLASPHHLATAAGVRVLTGGGNALDAAIAANLTLAVVAPYTCGFGGDCFALVWDGALHAYNGSGRAPAAATPAAVRAALGPAAAADGRSMPASGPLTVTVPGAVDAWFALLERFGTQPFAELAAPALAYARDGFTLSDRGAAAIAAGRPARSGWGEWDDVYGGARAGARLSQPGLARTIMAIADGGPRGFYQGPPAAALAGHVQRTGGLLSDDDLATHQGEWVRPVSGSFRDVEVVQLPPNSQGTAALLALHLVEGAGAVPADTEAVEHQHLLIEAVKVALAERDDHLTDPGQMRVPPAALASLAWAESCRHRLGPRAAELPRGRAARGGTAYLCAADPDGLCVSLIQSNYTGFGSGLTVPGYGINLHNRGADFSLDPEHINVIAPGKRTRHTLMPAMALRDGRPWLVFGTMGGDGQAQTQVQILSRLLDGGDDVAVAVASPRWRVDPNDWSLLAESRFPPRLLDGLRRRGHLVATAPPYDSRMGHAQAIAHTPGGLAATSDPRGEGLVSGF